jgi:hypothetical protein
MLRTIRNVIATSVVIAAALWLWLKVRDDQQVDAAQPESPITKAD